MQFRTCLFLLLAFALIAAGCQPGAFSAAGASAAESGEDLKSPTPSAKDCPVTRPPDPLFVPPDPYPPQPPDGDRFWYGENGLWTALPEDGSWRQLAMGEKFWWWSKEFDVTEDSTPDLQVTARRLDGTAEEFQVSGATNGYHPSFHWAMLIGVQLASPGCWKFTGEYNGQQLSFVLWVPLE